MSPNRTHEPRSASADDVFTLVPYRDEWHLLAQQVAAEVSASLWSVEVVHIGSTAVPGLAAKPVIDLMADIAPAEMDRAAAMLRSLGYHERPGRALAGGNLDGRERHLVRVAPVAVDVVFIPASSPLWAQRINVRDYLVAHPDRARAYGRSKSGASSQHAEQTDRDSKGQALAKLTELASAWRGSEHS